MSAALLAIGCAPEAKSQGPQRLEPAPRPPASAATVAIQRQHSERGGLDTSIQPRLVWRRSPPGRPPSETGCSSSRLDHLEIGEVRTDGQYLYLDVTHKAAFGAAQHEGESPALTVLVDRCKVETPALLSGTVYRNWEDPSTLLVPLVSLPDGELDLVVSAFGVEDNIALLKAGKELRPLLPEERKGYQRIPANHALGIPEGTTVGLIACDTVAARGVR